MARRPGVIVIIGATVAAAQWDLLLPVNVGPLSNRWSAAASDGSCMFVTGGTGAAGNATFQFDPNAMEWTQLPDLPDSYLAPATVAFGGILVMIGGQGSFGRSDDVLVLVRGGQAQSRIVSAYLRPRPFLPLLQSTTNSSAGWQQASLAGPSCGVRNGHRALALGGVLYLLGGWDGAVYFNDLWALDLTSLLLLGPGGGGGGGGGGSVGWVQLLPQNAPGMISPRSSFSWDAVGGLTLVFGGSEAAGWASQSHGMQPVTPPPLPPVPLPPSLVSLLQPTSPTPQARPPHAWSLATSGRSPPSQIRR